MDRKYLAIAVIAIPSIYCYWDLDYQRKHPTPQQAAELHARECAAYMPSRAEIDRERRKFETWQAMDVDGKRYNVDDMVNSVIRLTLPKECR